MSLIYKDLGKKDYYQTWELQKKPG
ncbi:MAG: hypothetical protein UZ05_CHB002001176, partial [Chlorobi bacterium OLB5]